jgi:hypothetical protein
MKNTVEFYRLNPNNFPFKIAWKLFIGKDITHVKRWEGIQDYVLCNLILQYGFGNWEKMLMDKNNWWKWMGIEYKDLAF